ncbi:ribonuclease E/G-like protein, chloroplastic isoform X2 [Impatiens glandulifera]|uniref:ribonuclease E/G-like protein, chloroplastic isoform X2 n=1 Tax=Impatiens glandulifera TaxID=253017 RepID=UPI001FB1164F|nr:ribonuclease E/G-like protein, chloroplastic isoform X2 [Impatiens glandulifera]
MSSYKHSTLCGVDLEIASLRSFRNSCFVKVDLWAAYDITRRVRPSYATLSARPGKQLRKVWVKHSSMGVNMKRYSDIIIGPWKRDSMISLRPFILSAAKNTYFGNSFAIGRVYPEIYPWVEEPWLVQPSVLHNHVANSSTSNISQDNEEVVQSQSSKETNDFGDSVIEHLNSTYSKDVIDAVNLESNLNGAVLGRNYPVEEPWLFESSLCMTSVDAVSSDDESVEAAHTVIKDEHLETADELFSEEKNSTDTDDSLSTIILINSSVCTMQRIAVLEDGKLVELLLEPIKNIVQCDSVYLGVITKLVPHMGGAFVNIGSTRPSLMDIKHYKKPFIFPSYHHHIEEDVNGHSLNTLGLQEEARENENNMDEADVAVEIEEHETDNELMQQYMHNHYTEQETEDDFDIQEVVGENVNGSLSGNYEVDSHFDVFPYQADTNIHLAKEEDETSNNLGVKKDASKGKNNWSRVKKGTKIVVQVVKEGLGSKGPMLTAYPKLRSRFWVLITRCNTIGVSKKISGVERTRLRLIAKTLQPQGFGLTVRTVAAGHSIEELQKDLEGLLSSWKDIMEHAKSAVLAADEGIEGAVPILLHSAMGQTLSVVQDYFNEKVASMVVDSPRIYYEITNYLQEIAPKLCDRVELYTKRVPLFDEYNIEEEINNTISKRVPLDNGGYLVIEQTEALVSIDVNGGQCMLGQGTSQEKAILNVNLAAAKQIARELRLRDVGGIIVVDFIDMLDDANKRLVYEEVKRDVERDRSMVKVSELSKHGLMEITRKRVRPSVTFMISEPCNCCHATGRVEALETSFSKIEHGICRHLAMMDKRADPENPKTWPRFVLHVDRYMSNYLTSGKKTRLAVLSSSLKVWILLKVARGFTRGAFDLKPLVDEKDYKNQNQVAISILGTTTKKTEASSDRRSDSGKKVTIYPIKKWRTAKR